MTPNEAVANLLAEVKLAERRLEKAQERLAPLPDRIKAALRAQDRAAAERLALAFEEAKADVARAEQDVAAAKASFTAGKQRGADLTRAVKAAQANQALLGPLEAMAKANKTASAGDEMLKRLEEEAAMSEARLEVALGDAPPLDEPPPPRSPEDILRELEGGA
jgi:chromosome segregation ATPase